MFATLPSAAFARAGVLSVPKSRASVVAVRASSSAINPNIKKDEPKVVDTVNCSDIKGKGVYCRCWKSKKFPLCDGAHVKHNEETGDNVGPLIISNDQAK